MSMTLKQMRYALAVAEEGHFGRAADKCHVTQSALSQQIRLLEETCDTPLFDRLGRQVRVTPFGREFLERARSILRDTDALTAFATSHRGNPARPLQLGIIPTVAPYLLPDVYPALRQRLPGIEFLVSENRTEQLLDSLDNGIIDLALIATDPPGNTRLHAEPLFADSFVLATSESANVPDPADLADLPKERIMLLDEGHCFRDQAIEACALRGDEAARTFAATSLSTIVEFVANGQGHTLLPAISLRKEATDPRIRIHALAAPGAGRMLSLVWRESTPFTELFERIAGIIRSTGEARLAETLPRARWLEQSASPT